MPAESFKRPLLVAGTASGVGKTTVAAGIMGALARRGLKVAPFKTGPDYIDPGYHAAVTGVPSRNLDTWLTPTAVMEEIYRRGAAGADVCVIEGAMGLFDGRAGGGDSGSAAEIARRLGAAVVLVVDCGRMARSLAPLLAGFAGFDERIDITGAILNNVGSLSHERLLKQAAAEAGVPVLGVLPRRDDIRLPSRHLGLVQAGEEGGADALAAIVDHVEAQVDIEALLGVVGAERSAGATQILRRAAPQNDHTAPGFASRKNEGASISLPLRQMAGDGGGPEPAVRLAVARDEAFSFYYQDGLEALQAAGARLVFFSPLRDSALPSCDGLYLGGGYPEVHAAALEANRSMRESVAAAARAGLPVYAECGGLTYLCRGIEVDGAVRQMAGALPLDARMTGKRQALGYVEATARTGSILFAAGERVRGHEFHWSQVAWSEGDYAYDCVSTREPGTVRPEGCCRGSVLASYVHINFAGYPAAAARFVQACARSKGAAADVSV